MAENDKYRFLAFLTASSVIVVGFVAIAMQQARSRDRVQLPTPGLRPPQEYRIERPDEDDGLRAIQIIDQMPMAIPSGAMTTAEQSVAIMVSSGSDVIHFGSGFVLRPSVIVSAAHLFDHAKEQDGSVSVICDGSTEDGRIMAMDRTGDIVLIEARCAGVVLRLDDADMDEDETVFLAGYTFAPQPSAMIEAARYAKTSHPAPEERLSIRPELRAVHGSSVRGQSGSPIFRKDGGIIGMLVITDAKRKLTFYVTAGDIRRFLDRIGIMEDTQ